ncbi:MAG TPA: 16S rRNA (uracil(1498)-N(3))-methyltransferase [Stellaceae bacterium]|jgi:16S rRNA (uracil1498-N3)-methyltransferase
MPIAKPPPAAKPKTRLYADAATLAAGLTVELSPAQAHQLRNVLRLAAGDAVALFNRRDGEWLGRIAGLGKGWATVELAERMRPPPHPSASIDLWLVFAPVKGGRVETVVEKATELGVSALLPVLTERSVVDRVNVERLAAHAVEAAEQCERLDVPPVYQPQRLDRLIASWPAGRRLLLCDETGAAPPLAQALLAEPAWRSDPAAVLTGPEGGFAETELDALRKLPFVSSVGLGPRVLRADTAALAALSVFQALAGDWHHHRSAA